MGFSGDMSDSGWKRKDPSRAEGTQIKDFVFLVASPGGAMRNP
jgi:hypothetical protein